MKETKKRILSIFLCLMMALGLMAVPMQAAEASETTVTNQAVLDDRNGVLEVVQVVIMNGNVIAYGRGTGFLVGNDNGAQTVITNHHVANTFPHDDTNLKAAIEALYTQELGQETKLPSDVKLSTELRIIVKRDVYVTAEIVNQSEAGDFSILKLSQPIYDREPLTFADSSTVTPTQQVYALGFPAAVEGSIGGKVGDAVQIDAVYTADDVTITTGTISKISISEFTGAPISTILHSATISAGNSGGPLVDGDGNVVGLNTYGDETTYFYSTESNEVVDVLEALGIDHKTVDGGTSESETSEPDTNAPETQTAATETEAVSPLLGDLQGAISAAEAADTTNMTEDSVAALKAAITNAKTIANKAGAADADIQSAIDELQTAQNGLTEQKGSNSTMIIIIAAAAVVVILIIVIIVVSSGKKKKEEERRRAEQERMRAEEQRKRQSAGGSAGQWVQQKNVNNFSGSDGSGETSVLNEGAGETTVLGGGQMIPPASLIRKKNGERITISKAVFKIGKERRKVDYCISDNTNISRTHADIVFKNGGFYVVDQNATNGTSVNGSTVAAGQERKLNNGDAIRLADEEFQFKM